MSSNKNQQTNGSGRPAAIEDRKEFGLSSFSIDNRISVLVITFLVVVMGITSYLAIPKEAQPDITIPNVLVITTYPGVAPEDMESLVTRKLEDELSNISDIKEMGSTSAEGYSNINLEFSTDVDINEALQKVREKVDLAKPELPDAAEDPIIQEINVSEFPIMQINISGEYDMVKLKQVAEDFQDRLESIPSVLEVDLAGGLEREVKIEVDLPKLKYYGLAFNDIIAAIQSENVTIPGGDIEVGNKKFLVRVPGEYDTPQPIEDIVITSNQNRPIYIRDIADVSFGFKDRETYSELNNNAVITLSVKKRAGENILETSAAIRGILAEQEAIFPPTTHVEITSDETDRINSMVSSLENNIISGLILVIGVLLFFLGVRNASFVGIAIPLSMFTSFIIIQIMGITMNMVVLFSLILALGMLVDNAIVVVENIYRYLEEGYSNFEAARKGTGEVAIPIITGTLTTLAAFFPMMFWPGITGEFMSFLPKTLIITLGSSLFVALVINPVLCALFMRVELYDETSKPSMSRKGKMALYLSLGAAVAILLFIDPITWGMLLGVGILLWLGNRFLLNPVGMWWQAKGLSKVLGRYETVLRSALNRPLGTTFIAVFVLIGSFFVFAKLNNGIVFFPEDIPPTDIYVQVEAPVGTNVEYTKSLVDTLESRADIVPNSQDIKSVLATSGTAITSGLEGSSGNSEYLGTVAVSFKDFQLREGSSIAAMEYLREHVSKGLAGAEITVEEPQQGPATGKPINLELAGKDMDRLKEFAQEAITRLENDPVYAKLEGLEDDLPESRPELKIVVDREKAALFGLTTSEIGNTVRRAINGEEASTYRDGKEEYDITVRLKKQYRNDLSAIGDLNVIGDDDAQIPLSAVANWQLTEGFGGIKHKDQKRVITVMSDVRSAYQANAVLAEVQNVLKPFIQNLPDGYSHGWTGQQEEQKESQEFLTYAFLVSLLLIGFILISQFNSLAKPLIVMSSVIMSISGVLIGLVIFQMPFGVVMTGIGVISLAGVVVNNAIVLIDYIDILRERDNMDLYEALVEAGKIRFRPVILTAITTTLGLVPLAIGFNLDFITLVASPIEFFTNINQYLYWGGEQAAWWSPMAIAVIIGLLFATVLTLVLVPVIYYLVEKGREGTNKFFYNTKNPGIFDDTERKEAALVNGKPDNQDKGEPAFEQMS